jgi:chromosome segregation ATPase
MSAEQPSVEALVERIAKELPNPSWAHAALDSLTAEIERLKGLLYAEQHGKHAEKWNELAAALERAERERDEARVYERQEARNYWIASRNEWKARAQKAEDEVLDLRENFLNARDHAAKAEAVVEAAREVAHDYVQKDHIVPFMQVALTAYDDV